MDRVYQSNVSDVPCPAPAPGANGFVQSDVPLTLQLIDNPTSPGPFFYQYVTESFRAVIVAARMVPDALNLHQLRDAVIFLAAQGYAPPLDPLSVRPHRAFSTRLLLSSYTGPCMRVRRSSDNAQADIGFTVAGALDTDALAAFVGSGSGYVVTWYDQSGNAGDATQSIVVAQPAVVLSGALVTLGTKPALHLNTSQNLRFGIAVQSDFTLGSVFKTTQSNGLTLYDGFNMSGFVYADTGGTASDFAFGNLGNRLTLWGGARNEGIQGATVINDGAAHVGIATHLSASGASNVYLDGNLDASGSGILVGPRTASLDCQIGSAGQGSGSTDGSGISTDFTTTENLVFSSALSDSDLQMLQDAQATYRGVQ